MAAGVFGGKMLEKESEGWLRQLFADQFEPDGNEFIFRYNLKSAPIRVTRAERDRYVDTFNKFNKWSLWLLIGAILLLAGLYVIFLTITDQPVSGITVYIGIGVLMIGYMIAFYWIRGFPMRELRGRPTVGEPRSRVEIRDLMISRMSCVQIVIIGTGGLFVLSRIDRNNDLFSGWNLALLVFAAFAIVAAIVTAFRKWRLKSGSQ